MNVFLPKSIMLIRSRVVRRNGTNSIVLRAFRAGKAPVGLMLGLFLTIFPRQVHADVSVVKEVVVAPKSANAAANIGAVNTVTRVRLTRARVDIHVGEPVDPGPGEVSANPIPLNIRGTFELLNESNDALKLTVGFPVSDSAFSAFRFEWFRVSADGEAREVFRRVSSYPRHLSHEYVSGTLGPGKAQAPSEKEESNLDMMGVQMVGTDRLQNLMVWEERFTPGQKRTVLVEYEIHIPLQETTVTRRRIEGNYKGIWPQEANNLPLWFLDRLPGGSYYFFDYYLTSGASWAGSIGEEEVVLHFGPWWQGHEFHSSSKEKLAMGSDAGRAGTETVYAYMLRNEEPRENLYFAVRPVRIP